jgi:hypothetical protein
LSRVRHQAYSSVSLDDILAAAEMTKGAEYFPAVPVTGIGAVQRREATDLTD